MVVRMSPDAKTSDASAPAARRRAWWTLRFGLRAQLVVALTVVVLTLVLTLGGIALWSLDRGLRREARRRADTTAELAATLVSHGAKARAPLATALRRGPAWTSLRRLHRQVGVVELLVVRADGQRVRFGDSGLPVVPASEPGLSRALEAGRLSRSSPGRRSAPGRTTRQGGLLVAYRPARLASRQPAAIRVVVSPDRYVHARLGPTRRLLVILSILDGLLVLGFGLLWLQRRILGPLRVLEQATARVAAGDREARMPVSGDGDFDRLGRRFNDMLERLKAKDRRLQSQVEALQAKQQELDQSWEVLLRSAKLASVGRLTAGVAHELGNPLSSILGYLELVSDPEAPEVQRQEWIGKVRAELQRMDDTIRALLETARPGDDSVVRTDVERAVIQAVELVRHQRRMRGVDIRLELESLPPVAASARLSQVFVNLLLNAADARGGKGEITLWARVEGNAVQVTVSDDGPGIPADVRETLFDPFVTTKDPGHGTGLGLAICQSILEGSGGRIRLTHPQPARGASFELTLPLWQGGD